MPAIKRRHYLDGLRGLACMMVVLMHYCNQIDPAARRGCGILANGEAAVLLFFIMSGFVLTGSFGAQRQSVPILALRRLVRLVLPVLAATGLSFVLAPWGHGWILNAATLLNAFDGHDIFIGYNGGPFGLWPVVPMLQQPNPALWTISVEIWGSLWVLALVQAGPRWGWALVMLPLLLGAGNIALFSLGYVFARARLPQRNALGLPLLALGVGLIMQCGFAPPGLLLSLGCALLVLGLLMAPAAQGWFALDLPLYLGRLSFSIYLIHFPLLVAMAAFLPRIPAGLAFAGLVGLGIPLTLGLAELFYAAVDAPAIRLGRRLMQA